MRHPTLPYPLPYSTPYPTPYLDGGRIRLEVDLVGVVPIVRQSERAAALAVSHLRRVGFEVSTV